MDFEINPIGLYQIICLATFFVGLTLAILLWSLTGEKRRANRLLGLALVVLGLQVAQMQAEFSLLLGPLLYNYVKISVKPGRAWQWYDVFHLITLLLGLFLKSWHIPALTLIYLLVAWRLVNADSRQFQPGYMDRPLYAFRQMKRGMQLLMLISLLWLFDHIFSLCFAVALIGIAFRAVLETATGTLVRSPVITPSGIRERGRRLKRAVNDGRLYEDPELTIGALAEKLGVQPHELSRIINQGLKKNFPEFISELRVAEVARKMKDPAYNRMTLLGIAYDSGFNSKTSFHRIFKELTGKSPATYQKDLKKEVPFPKLEPRYAELPIILDQKSNRYFMFRSYFKIAWRNLLRNKVSGTLNISGLAVGMATAILIGLWIWDELSFNQYHRHYDRVAMVMQHKTLNGTINTDGAVPLPLDEALRKDYGQYFKHIVLASWNDRHVLNFGAKNIRFNGNFMGQDGPEMLTLRMLTGNRDGLKDHSAMLLSASAAKALFGNADPLSKVIRLDNKDVFKVAGVYEDLPENSSFHDLAFIGAFDYYIHAAGNERSPTDWGDNSLQMYVELANGLDMSTVSARIKDIKLDHVDAESRKFKPTMFLQPMHKWHLYSEFKNGVNTGGAIQYVWLFGIIGIFVLLLACINFMNLSTARSEKRAKEVGIRKAVGSLRGQLIQQFYCESFLIAFCAFMIALVLVWLALPWFNAVAGKQSRILWAQPLFWAACLGFTVFTGIIAGSYPALYLSAFNPVKVLKGTFKAGPLAALPRKILVVTQFTVSVVLIIGTIIVFKQVQFAKDLPVGYNRASLIDVAVTNDDLHKHFSAVRADLLATGAVTAVGEASSTTTGINNNRGDINWQGKDPAQADFFGSIRVNEDYGKAVGWQFTAGRDFIPGNVADSLSLVLNEAAVRYMGFKNPVGQIVHVGKRDLTVIGVVKNMVMESPYEPVKQTIFYLGPGPFADVLIRINPNASAHAALNKIAAVSRMYSPAVPFAYKFVDDEYAGKFKLEERVGKLAGAFAGLAIFISCLGLFGMASFMAEQRVKEIGVRKVLGASVFAVWRLLSMDFILLIGIALLIATPVAYSLMHSWLQHYTYHTGLPWWIFASVAILMLVITLLTVSYQSLKAALMNPVRSLRSE